MTDYDCANCGHFSISDTADAIAAGGRDWTPRQRAVVSHATFRARQGQGPVVMTSDVLSSWLEDDYLPRPPAQLDALLLWLGQESQGTGAWVAIDTRLQLARLGAIDNEAASFILCALRDEGHCELCSGDNTTEVEYLVDARLSVSGWRRFDELIRGRTIGVGAFMAMPFGRERLDAAFSRAFKPGAAAAGFDLCRLDEAPTAGIIDIRLRNEIRTAAFLVADLTERNPGAYWEAGFAEGLGKPVIYTCEQTFFEEQKTHFDTNHCHTVIWSAGNFEKAAADLAAVVRNTLPEQARFPTAEE